MTRFLLVRHAKADRPPGTSDIDRPLADRGRIDAAVIGRLLGGAMAEPAVVLSSPAVRARDTAALVLDSAGWQTTIAVDERLYHGGVGDLIALLGAPGTGPVVAFGHEPVWSDAIAVLSGAVVHMVTAAAACLDGTAAPGGAALQWMVTPAILGAGRR